MTRTALASQDQVFRHKDTAHAEELLKEIAGEPGHKLIITDGVFPMDGDIDRCPLCATWRKSMRHHDD